MAGVGSTERRADRTSGEWTGQHVEKKKVAGGGRVDLHEEAGEPTDAPINGKAVSLNGAMQTKRGWGVVRTRLVQRA